MVYLCVCAPVSEYLWCSCVHMCVKSHGVVVCVHMWCVSNCGVVVCARVVRG